MQQTPETKKVLKVWTVGHSIYPMPDFIELLRMHEIEVIADVRSNPYSRYATHFHGPILQRALRESNLKYVFLGKELGGKPKEAEFYDENGHADYGKLASSAMFKSGFERLLNGLSLYRVALMCGEEDPSDCHRHLLIARTAIEAGIQVLHIRKGGVIQDYESLLREKEPETFASQLNLFSQQNNTDPNENVRWRSKSKMRDSEEKNDYHQ